MKVLLLGANGQLGSVLAPALQHEAAVTELVQVTRQGDASLAGALGVDLADSCQLGQVLDDVKPRLIINASAYTAVDRAESEEAIATAINGDAVGAMGAWAARHDATVLHVSTDYVFDGSASTPYRPDAPTAPINAYGRSKLAGERQLAASGARHLVLRTAWLYSASHPSFMGTMLRLAAQRDELRVVADQIGSPTPARVLAEAITATLPFCAMHMPASDARWGVHHVVAAGQTSWHGFASAIIQGAHDRGILHAMPRVSPISTGAFPTPAHRPAYSVLDTTRFTEAFGWQPGEWRELLAIELNDLTC